MTIILLILIYLAFISLGLPDSIVGVTIPALQSEFGIKMAAGGVISMIVILGSVVSSFLSHKIIRIFDTGKIVFFSCLTTGLALLGFTLSPTYIWLVILAFPLGLGGGTVDASLNNYVATHFKAHHMNWLHSFWGVGATLGPIIISWNMVNKTWRSGIGSISLIQLILAVILLLSLPVWKKQKKITIDTEEDSNRVETNIFKIKGIKSLMLTMLFYCAAELGTGLWGSSYLIKVKGFNIDTAARYISLYYAGITIGRFLSGFVSFKLNNKQLIKYGSLVSLLGILTIMLSLPELLTGSGLILTGLGFAPIFPSMIHETPTRFGKVLSQKIIGYQMGFAYIGSAILPPLLGLLFQYTNIVLLPVMLFVLVILLFINSEILNRTT